MCVQDEMLIYSIPPLPSLRPWSTQASAFAGMSSDSESSDGEAPAPVKVEAAPSKVWIDVHHRVLPFLSFVRDTICSRHLYTTRYLTIRLCRASCTLDMYFRAKRCINLSVYTARTSTSKVRAYQTLLKEAENHATWMV